MSGSGHIEMSGAAVAERAGGWGAWGPRRLEGTDEGGRSGRCRGRQLSRALAYVHLRRAQTGGGRGGLGDMLPGAGAAAFSHAAHGRQYGAMPLSMNVASQHSFASGPDQQEPLTAIVKRLPSPRRGASYIKRRKGGSVASVGVRTGKHPLQGYHPQGLAFRLAPRNIRRGIWAIG